MQISMDWLFSNKKAMPFFANKWHDILLSKIKNSLDGYWKYQANTQYTVFFNKHWIIETIEKMELQYTSKILN